MRQYLQSFGELAYGGSLPSRKPLDMEQQKILLRR